MYTINAYTNVVHFNLSGQRRDDEYDESPLVQLTTIHFPLRQLCKR